MKILLAEKRSPNTKVETKEKKNNRQKNVK